MASKSIVIQIRPRGKPINSLPESLTVDSDATTSELYQALSAKSHFSVHQLRITKGSDGSVVANDKDRTVHSTGLRDQSTVYVKDLGRQIGWRTVFIIEYAGPVIIHPLIYTARPYIYPSAPAQGSQLQAMSMLLIVGHFLKRELETMFVHRFSASTMPFRNVFKNSFHYWALAGLNIAAWIYSPSAPTAKEPSLLLLYTGLALYSVGEFLNLQAHLTLMNLRSPGGSERAIPHGPLFDLVTCPNYMTETLSWIGIYIVSGFSWSVFLFLCVSVGQMMLWAKKKENRYRKEFGDKYKKKRYTMLPGIWMHFALPPKGSPPYARAATRKSSILRQTRLRYIGYLVLGLLSIFLLFRFLSSPDEWDEDVAIPDESQILIVTVLDEARMSDEYIRMIKNNRDTYAARHGYKTFYTNVSTYAHLTEPSPSSWALIPALRNSLTRYPDVEYLWSLSPYALIMNHTLSIHSHILSRLDTLMLKDIPVVPPDSVIHTFSHLKASQVHLILTQDANNIGHTSFLLRNTNTIPVRPNEPKDSWSQYFLDVWFDPLYRAYAFQKAENHALEHIVQWHPTLLAKLVIIEQRLMNSYNFRLDKQGKGAMIHKKQDSMYEPGDFVVNMLGCADSTDRDCHREVSAYYARWQQNGNGLGVGSNGADQKTDTLPQQGSQKDGSE